MTARRPFSWWRLLAGTFATLALAGCGATTLPAVHSSAERLAVAQQLMAKRQWTAASDLLKTYVADNPGGAEVDEAIELLGECDLRLKDYPAAQVEFERLLRDYPESDSSGTAALRLGDALYGQSRPTDFDQEYTHKALEQWQSYLRDYPGHWANPEGERKVAKARRQLASKLLETARLYAKMKLWGPARVYFERVEQDYGDLDIAGEALLGLARVDVEQGRRDQALERLQQVETRFAGQSLGREAARDRARLEH